MIHVIISVDRILKIWKMSNTILTHKAGDPNDPGLEADNFNIGDISNHFWMYFTMIYAI
jgi:hypothetical protein